MIETFVKEGKTYANISYLHHWEKNPRKATNEDRVRLIKQIKELGQYKPLLITPDGEVLGGNMRLDAYGELGIAEVWVSMVNPENESGKFKFALSDNDHVGIYDERKISDLLITISGDFDASLFKVNLSEGMLLSDFTEFPVFPEKQMPDTISLEHECPKCGFKY